MHPCFQNGDYPADAQNHHQNSTKSPNATAQRNVIVKVAFFASKSEAQQNSGHGARAPGNDCPPRGPPPMSFLRSLSPRRRGAGTQFYSANQPYFVAKE